MNTVTKERLLLVVIIASFVALLASGFMANYPMWGVFVLIVGGALAQWVWRAWQQIENASDADPVRVLVQRVRNKGRF